MGQLLLWFEGLAVAAIASALAFRVARNRPGATPWLFLAGVFPSFAIGAATAALAWWAWLSRTLPGCTWQILAGSVGLVASIALALLARRAARSGRLPSIRILAAALVVAMALAGLTFERVDASARRELEAARVETARRVERPSIPDAENAAIPYLEACRRLDQLSETELEWLYSIGSPDFPGTHRLAADGRVAEAIEHVDLVRTIARHLAMARLGWFIALGVEVEALAVLEVILPRIEAIEQLAPLRRERPEWIRPCAIRALDEEEARVIDLAARIAAGEPTSRWPGDERRFLPPLVHPLWRAILAPHVSTAAASAQTANTPRAMARRRLTSRSPIRRRRRVSNRPGIS